MMSETGWQLIANAPFDHDLELAVIEDGEIHRLTVRCRRTSLGWINAVTGAYVDVDPTHWRHWKV